MAQSQNGSYTHDPILEYRPPFVRSLPVQILVTGITLSLTTVLLFHLIFTAQYHWPLARTNYALQMTGVVTLLISTSATLYVIFSATMLQSLHWPYMLDYLAVPMPPSHHHFNSTDPTLLYHRVWNPAERSTWVVMNATTSVVVQITHIHFLTLLFPSDLEARLIFGLLGPLAIISAVMQLLPLVSSQTVAPIAEDTRNVCNAALSVLFTSFLIIWGFFVNRRQAWRTDGGTAAFGAAAIILAFISTSFNFLYIPRQDQYTWMPKLMWGVTLWQSFLGWWWWVGAGMGVREVEELLERENKQKQKRIRRAEQREKAKSVWKGVTGAFKPTTRADASPLVSSRAPSQDDGSTSTATALGWATSYPLQTIQRWYGRLRHAHLTAAHIQAAERAERLHQVYQCEGEWNPERPYHKPVVGWGLGSFGLREAERREQMEMQERIPPPEDEEEWEDEPTAVPEPQLRHRGGRGSPPSPPAQQDDQPAGSSLWWWGPLRQWRLQDSTKYR